MGIQCLLCIELLVNRCAHAQSNPTPHYPSHNLLTDLRTWSFSLLRSWKGERWGQKKMTWLCVCLLVGRKDTLYSDGCGCTNLTRQPTPGQLHHRGQISLILPQTHTSSCGVSICSSQGPSHISRPSWTHTHMHSMGGSIRLISHKVMRSRQSVYDLVVRLTLHHFSICTNRCVCPYMLHCGVGLIWLRWAQDNTIVFI